MSLPVRFLLLLPAIALLAIFAPTPALTHAAAPKAPPIIGIADQKPAFLADPAFLSLGVKHARVAVAWDALTSDWQVDELDRWMNAARTAGVEPLVTFDHSRLAGRVRLLPTPAQLQAQFRAFRARYPWVHEFSTWNEANFPGQAVGRRPELVARYYLALKRACKACRVLGADLLDLPSTPAWVRRFVKVAGQPRFWGFHNYVTANRLQTSRTKQLLAVTRGQIWLTETGGLVAKRNKSLISLPQGKTHAAKVTRFILRDIAGLSPRIARVYLYQWEGGTASDTWDSGFVGSDGQARPALGVLKQILAAPRPV
ncbi:MAG: hypothetical protein E6G10_21075 [Actinobacteria bacterium]|nr:MAG: hypothetical protein E6G10_21075 [Actinomycetota bacterium]